MFVKDKEQEATRNKCHATSNKCLTSSNKKLLGISATLLVAKGVATRNKKLLGAPGLTRRNVSPKVPKEKMP